MPNADDCGPDDATSFPGGVEVCDGVDNDCDGTVDEDATDAPSWYADYDQDLFGDPENFVRTCVRPIGYSEHPRDCDDADDKIHPGATEWCDYLDNDCDGLTDETDAMDQPTWYTDADGDGLGDPRTGALACHPADDQVANAIDCDDTDANQLDGTTWYADVDGDGFAGTLFTAWACEPPASFYLKFADDCDDLDATSHPDADELCDGADNDCDGELDEEAVDQGTWYADADGDLFGNAAAAVTACAQPAGTVANDTDCNDLAATANPAAREYCDRLDNDCDGSTDESDAVDAPTWHIDHDHDGFGKDTATLTRCSDPSTATVAYVEVGGDCDDARFDRNPGAVETLNRADDDCDDVQDEVAIDSTAETVFDSGRNVGGLGPVGDVNGDGTADVALFDYARTNLYIVDGSTVGGGGVVDFDDDYLVQVHGADFRATVPAGDLDDDGYDDFLVADVDKLRTGVAGAAGAVLLYSGAASWSSTLYPSAATAAFSAESTSDALGWKLAFEDVDGDHYGDVVTSAYRNGGTEGAVYVVFGSSDGFEDMDIGDADVKLSGETLSTPHLFGSDVDVADVDGDGEMDLLVGSSAGAYLYLGSSSWDGATSADADATVTGTTGASAKAGLVNAIGDFDSDGYAELALAASQGVFVVAGSSTPTDASLGAAGIDHLLTDATLTDLAAGDIDRDHRTDLVASDWRDAERGSDTGAVFLVRGSSGGLLASTTDDAFAKLHGSILAAKVGAFTTVVDLDDDGASDILTTAPGAGQAYLVLGGW